MNLPYVSYENRMYLEFASFDYSIHVLEFEFAVPLSANEPLGSELDV